MNSGRERLTRALRVGLLLALVGWALWYLGRQWEAARDELAQLEPRLGLLALSGLLVFAAHAILVESWRTILASWQARLRFLDAARIWSVSNLGRYVPGKVWQISAMAMMARERGVAGVAAGGSAILSTLVALASGFAVVAVTGSQVLRSVPTWAGIGIALAGASVMLAPPLIPRASRLAQRLTGRAIELPRISNGAMWAAAALSAMAWCVLGAAFHLLSIGLLGDTRGSLAFSIGAFTGSYLIGFVVLIAPAGVGPREVSMAAALRAVGFPPGETVVLVLASRLWLTVLEILPALLFLLLDTSRRHRPPAVADTER